MVLVAQVMLRDVRIIAICPFFNNSPAIPFLHTLKQSRRLKNARSQDSSLQAAKRVYQIL
jgi:hypothetical protein